MPATTLHPKQLGTDILNPCVVAFTALLCGFRLLTGVHSLDDDVDDEDADDDDDKDEDEEDEE